MSPRPLPHPFACEAKFLAQPPRMLRRDGLFEGYASLFRIADLGKDVVEPGAFRDSLMRRGPAGVKLLWQHDPSEPIGRWLSLTEDSRGLFVRGQLLLAVARAREIHALMREGAVDGLSIGFRSERARTEPRTGLRRLERVDLWEISLVTFPMLPQARVSAVKALPGAAALAIA
jgi:HK97 family phage prohead protease